MNTASQSTQGTQKLRDPATARILRAYFDLYNEVGWGFLENVYRRGMVVGLRRLGAAVRQEVHLPVEYLGERIGDYYADLVVDDRVIVEIKSADALGPSHRAQLLNYLKASRIETGMLLNFGPRPSFARLIVSNRPSLGHPRTTASQNTQQPTEEAADKQFPDA